MRRHDSRTDQADRDRRRTRRMAALGALIGFLMASDVAFAVSNWTVGLNSGSAAEANSAAVNNLTIAAVATPAPGNLLYPSGTGDAVLTISNPNPFPVTVTALQLPANTVYANGYSNSALSTANAGCTSSTSLVTWAYATSTSGTSHTLTTALVVAASGQSDNPLTVTMTNDATMGLAAPAACENTYFSMPSLIGVTATAGGSPVSISPASDAWTS